MKNDTHVHYVWMGDLSTAIKKKACSLGPTSLAKIFSRDLYFMWVPETLLQEARLLFEEFPNIMVRSIHSLLDEKYHRLEVIKPQAPAILNLLERMGAVKAHTAQKDLVSFAVMSEYGGYYFDCTTFSEYANLPEIADFKMNLLERVRNKKPGTYPLLGPDIWAFAACAPAHPLFLTTLNLTLEYYKNPKKEIITGSIHGDYLEALELCYKGMDTLEWIHQHSWLDQYAPYGHILPELGLKKFNTGFWRRAENEPPEKKGYKYTNYEAFKALNLFALAPEKSQKEKEDKNLEEKASSKNLKR